MINFDFFVQEGCVSDEIRSVIESAIEKACNDVLGSKAGPVEFSWTVITKGFGFRGGIPSTTSLARSRIPDGCDRATRGRFLLAIANEWRRLTECARDEVIVSARDWSWAG
jgi:hypothetical protein